MSMSVGGSGEGDPTEMVDINTTPLIDVMLVLLIMLIITIPVQTHAVKLDLPVNQNQAPPPVDPVVVNLEIDFDGTIYWDGVVIPDRNTLEYRFQEAGRMGDAQPEFHIRPNRLVPYKAVAAVMASAQRLNVTKIGLVGGG